MSPVVNLYGGQKIAPEALPGARLSATETPASSGELLDEAVARKDEAAAGLGGAMVGAAGDAFRVIKAEKDRADQIAVFDLNNKLLQKKSALLYDPNNGALGVKGQAALPLPEQVGDQFKQYADSLAATMATPRQKEAFARLSLEHQTDLDLTLKRHVYQEMQTYEGNVLQATIDNNSDEAIRNASDPRKVGSSLGNIMTALDASAPRLGLPPEMLAEKKAAVRSQVMTGVIGSLVNQGQQKAAQAYYDEVKGDLKGSAVEHIERVLNEGRVKKESQTQADQIIAAGGTLTDQRAKAKAIDDPDVRDAVTARLEHENAVNAAAKRDATESMFSRIYDQIAKDKSVANITPSDWSGLTFAQKNEAQEVATRLAKGEPVEANSLTFYQLMTEATYSPKTFATKNLYPFVGKVTKDEFDHAMEVRKSIVNGEQAKADAALAGFRSSDQILKDTLAGYPEIFPNVDDAKQTPAERNAVANLRRLMDQNIISFEQQSGKKATDVDKQRLLDHILSKSVTATTPISHFNFTLQKNTGTFLNPTVTVTKPALGLTIDDVPKDQRKQIEDSARARGLTPTDTMILNAYIQSQFAQQK